ncbi:ras/Rap GTPase-activating protein SynGAP [Brachypodium distachyon]|nr:ras/Rap GTPase-activating protein SynGAP [Brachypodium distachyon]|eukprot:XP_003567006.2 ras/Rap GTPase-activating protein SynGAP [Brachypodium distachyon]
MVLMADDDNHHHHRTVANPSSPPSDSPPPAPAHRTRLHSFSFPTLSWGTHRLLRCSKNPASSPPLTAPDTPSPDKETAARGNTGGVGGSGGGSPQRPWNLRTRRSATAAPRKVRPDDAADAAAEHGPARPAEAKKRGFSIVLSKEEIVRDFALIRGTRPPRRPKKRPRTVQRQLDSLYPGLCLKGVTPDSYKIEER